MSQYLTTLQENKLLQLPFSTDKLKLLQKDTTFRLQVVSFKGMKAVKSIDDCYRKIRIVIVSMLTKIYFQYSKSNEQKLKRLKKIIYSSQLQNLTQSKGILKQQLLKLVAQQLNQLKISLNIQVEIIKMFNCIPFFDQVIMKAITEQNPLIIDCDCQIAAWVNREFSQKILWNEESFIQETQDYICLYGLNQQFHSSNYCKSFQCNYKNFQQYLRYSTQCFSSKDEQLSQVYDRMTRNMLFNSQLSPEQKIMPQSTLFHINSNFYSSVSSISPNFKNNYDQRQKQKQNHNVGMQSPEIKLFDCDGKNSTQRGSTRISCKQKQMKIIRRNSQKQEREGSIIWRILCCKNSF